MHKGKPKSLVCREKEVEEMSTWLEAHIETAKPGSIYVSGAPGTGKIATLVSLLAVRAAKHKYIIINCVVCRDEIFREIASNLCHGSMAAIQRQEDALKIIQVAITSSKEMIVLILDKVDHLESKDQILLFHLFFGGKFQAMSSHHSDQMSQRSPVSRIAL